MPEVHGAVLADEPRAIDDPGSAGLNRTEQHGIVGGVVLEVGVLDDDDVARGAFEPSLNRCAFSAVARQPLEDDVAVLLRALLEQRARTVRRSIVDDDNLLIAWRS